MMSVFSSCLMFSICGYADEQIGCQVVNHAQYYGHLASILAQTETVNSKVSAAESSQILLDCKAPSELNVSYQMNIQTDVSAVQTLQFYGKTFYKIRQVNGQTSGNAGVNYLIDHAYIAFSIKSMDDLLPISISQENQPMNFVSGKTMDTDHFNFAPYLNDVEIYFDALPTNDDIVTQLNAMPIRLNLGQFNIELFDKELNQKWLPAIAPQLNLNLTGIQFQRPTCFIQEQTVMMSELSVSAFDRTRPSLAGHSQPFNLDITCDGYLNQRKMNLTWKDNNWLDNTNTLGYLSSVTGEGYSNVGIQIRDERNQPITIGEPYDLSDLVKGKMVTRRYLAQYFLMASEPMVGQVNAQATIQIDYR